MDQNPKHKAPNSERPEENANSSKHWHSDTLQKIINLKERERSSMH